MTLNDLYVNERCLLVRQQAEALPKLMRDGKEHALFMALSNIELAARQAQEFLNQRRYSKALDSA